MRRLTLALVLLVGACGDAGPGTTTTEPRATSVTVVTTGPGTTTLPTPSTTSSTLAGDSEVFAGRRTTMVDTQIAARGITDPEVLAAMREVARHLFVPAEYVGDAYGDHPLPIGHGQTISQPYMVALMTEALAVAPGDRILEIGTGSGYQAAVLAAMGVEVYSIEIIAELYEEATDRLTRLGYDVLTLRADGYFGWEDHAPYDAIIVTAAPDHVPQPLVTQLAPGGMMVIPVGPVGAVQTLWRFTVDESGQIVGENLGAVRFVPFTRED